MGKVVMKFAIIIEYINDTEKVKTMRPGHRDYLRRFLENGQLFAAGPFGDESGALWILEAETMEAAETIVQGDPYALAGIFNSWTIRPFAYWSAKESKGA